MSRPVRFEDFRYLGDKRSQVVYDLDDDGDDTQALVAELLASEKFAAFSPDTLAEARNRGYRPHAAARRAIDGRRRSGRGGLGQAGERFERPLQPSLERDVGQGDGAGDRGRVVGQARELDP